LSGYVNIKNRRTLLLRVNLPGRFSYTRGCRFCTLGWPGTTNIIPPIHISELSKWSQIAISEALRAFIRKGASSKKVPGARSIQNTTLLKAFAGSIIAIACQCVFLTEITPSFTDKCAPF